MPGPKPKPFSGRGIRVGGVGGGAPGGSLSARDCPDPPLSLSTSGEGENRPGRAYLHLLLVVAKLAFFF